MTVGIILNILFLIVVLKFVTKRSKYAKLDHLAARVHKILGVSLLPLTIYHLISTWMLRKQRPVMMYILGFIMTSFIVIAIVSYLGRKRLKGKWIMVHRVAACSIMICLIGHIVIGVGSLVMYQYRVNRINITNKNIASISDGIYIGECNVEYIYAKVEVKVTDGTMVEINLLEHRTEKGHPAEAILEEMKEKQQVNVDTVSGATNSSKVIMKAVENALTE